MKDTMKDKCAEWMRFWSNGGGCESLRSHIVDGVLDQMDDETAEELNDPEKMRQHLKDNATDFNCAGEAYNNLIDDMIDDILKQQR